MDTFEALTICTDLIDNEYTLRDRDLRCTLCGNKVILTLPETPGQHKETCEIARAKAAIARLTEALR